MILTKLNSQKIARLTVNIEVTTANQIPLWIWLVAIGGALFLLLIIFLILWKCGCFKKKEDEDDPQYHQVYILNNINTHKLTNKLGHNGKTSQSRVTKGNCSRVERILIDTHKSYCKLKTTTACSRIRKTVV